MNGERSSMCISFSILMLGYKLSVGTHVRCQDLRQQNPGGIRGGIGRARNCDSLVANATKT